MLFKKQLNSNFDDNSKTCCCIIGGLDKKGESKIAIAADIDNTGKLTEKYIQKIIFSPLDMTYNECLTILNNNLNTHSNFAERTIKDIANKSKFVSPSGNMWRYDLHTGRSSIEEFI